MSPVSLFGHAWAVVVHYWHAARPAFHRAARPGGSANSSPLRETDTGNDLT
jgi:hypothetical protein